MAWGDRKEGNGGGGGKWKTCLFICSLLSMLCSLALSRYQATEAFAALKNSGKEREKERERCCLAMACCVVYTTKLSTQQNTVRRDVYFTNADLVLVEKNEEVQPTVGLGMGK